MGVGVDAKLDRVSRCQALPGRSHARDCSPSGGSVIAEPAARSFSGASDERVDIAIAADDPIEGDQVGRLDLRRRAQRSRHDGTSPDRPRRVARLPSGPRRDTAARRRRQWPSGAPLQQQLVDRADTTADVEHRPSLGPAPGERVGERPGRAPRTLAPVLSQLGSACARRTRRRSSSCSADPACAEGTARGRPG